MGNWMQTGSWKANVSASVNVCPRECNLIGIFVSAASSTPTITVYNSATTTTTDPIVTVFTPNAGVFYPIPAAASAGVYIVISGTVTCSIFFS